MGKISNKKQTLLVILGPTGVGKTNISLRIAQMLGCPIISADSRQLYRELKIGTAAPSVQELELAEHYFIATHSILDNYSAGQYELDVIKLLNQLFTEHQCVLLVGGSMLYIDSICNGIDDIPTVDPRTRQKWIDIYHQNGLKYIQNELKKYDPIHYTEVDKNNPKRILHALEVIETSGKPFSELRSGKKKKRDFSILKIGLNRERNDLYQRINDRVDQMMKDGLFDEAEKYYENRHLNTLNTVGYKELHKHIAGEYTYEYAVKMIKQNSRRYAKKQLSWFNRDKDIHWFHPEHENEIIQFITNSL